MWCRAGGVAVEGGPGSFVDLRFERGFAGVGAGDVGSLDLLLELAVLGGEDLDVGLAGNHEQTAIAGVLKLVV